VSIELDASRIVDTIRRLEQRISERFPGSGLSAACAELGALAAKARAEVDTLRQPIWPLRLLAAAGIAAIGAVALGLVIVTWRGVLAARGFLELLQGSESAVNEVLLLAAAVYFLFSLEERVKRRRTLAALHRLRSVVHIVDMHQLTKDPALVIDGRGALTPATASSPQRTLTAFELERYLDYCSEMFSLTSKVAALYAQSLNDSVVLEAVSDIETLGASLSNKVWQKIVVLGDVVP
jgi:hypothetical protein